MQPLLQRTVGVLLLVGALVGLLPLIPEVFGFSLAAVSTNQAGTWFPAASTSGNRFISCVQVPTPMTVRRNTTYNEQFFQCTNNWGAPATITVSLVNANGTGLTFTPGSVSLAAGQTGCVPITDWRATTATNTRDVLYQATVDQSDLLATVQFTGQVRVISPNTGIPMGCTP